MSVRLTAARWAVGKRGSILAAASVLFALVQSLPAHATGSGCAVVSATPDGFLNLREGPGVQFEPTFRLAPGDLLWVDTGMCGTLGEHTVCDRAGTWAHIESVQRLDAGRATYTQGWARTRYLRAVPCEFD